MYGCVHAYAYEHVCMYACVCVCACLHAYTYIYVCMTVCFQCLSISLVKFLCGCLLCLVGNSSFAVCAFQCVPFLLCVMVDSHTLLPPSPQLQTMGLLLYFSLVSASTQKMLTNMLSDEEWTDSFLDQSEANLREVCGRSLVVLFVSKGRRGEVLADGDVRF